MPFSLITGNWNGVLVGLAKPGTRLRIVCPFVQGGPIGRLLDGVGGAPIELITRYDLEAFARGVSDPEALALVLSRGGKVRGVKGVHAKLYLFGDHSVVGTSANLTEAALFRNEEFGFSSDEPTVVAVARDYWDRLWSAAGEDLSAARIDSWRPIILAARLASPVRPRLPDEGVSVGEEREPDGHAPAFTSMTPAHVKFFGEGHNRASRRTKIIDAVNSDGSHYACTYPKKRRPRQPNAGDVMYMADMVGDHSNDTLIYGRALVVRAHDDHADVASPAEIARRDWKATWPNYIRVHSPEFLRGELAMGISLNTMMNELKHQAFESTAENFARGHGNVSPQKAIRQKAAVKLSAVGAGWLHEQFERAARRYGVHDAAEIDALGRD